MSDHCPGSGTATDAGPISRARCPICDGVYQTRRDGTLRSHGGGYVQTRPGRIGGLQRAALAYLGRRDRPVSTRLVMVELEVPQSTAVKVLESLDRWGLARLLRYQGMPDPRARSAQHDVYWRITEEGRGLES